MQGCELVFHTASPFTYTIKDPQRDLVDPALLGTRNVLGSANRTTTMKRVVLTSSCAAIIGDAIDCLGYPGGCATEEQWNTTSTLKHQPYSYSKTVAEKAAWEICRAQERWDLVVINPSLVLGPAVNTHVTSESFNLVRQLGDGTMKTGLPDFRIGAVDVRDVAEAHYQAAFRPEASGRHIVSAEESDMMSLAGYLRKEFGDQYPFPKRKVPKFLIWLIAPSVGFTRKMISLNVGYPWKVDHSKSIRELGIRYRPLDIAVTEMFRQLIEQGAVKKK